VVLRSVYQTSGGLKLRAAQAPRAQAFGSPPGHCLYGSPLVIPMLGNYAFQDSIGVALTSALVSSDAVSVSIQKARGVIVRGYRDAVSRLRDAHDAWDHDGVYIALTEATNWLHSLNVSGHEDVDAVIFARNRSHHQWASIAYADEGRRIYLWRPASQLPPPDPGYGGKSDKERENKYVTGLAGKPLLEVFGRLDDAPVLRQSAPVQSGS
jgi:hypothetical protein